MTLSYSYTIEAGKLTLDEIPNEGVPIIIQFVSVYK
ncbi:hypothetical protein BACI349Y_900004 [Bacillus sp. 349Y]|nr:hypothetical protein BACI349Y_900004 [Bacillus sp. 349Y]